MKVNLQINLNNKDDIENTLLLIKQQKKNNELEKNNKVFKLQEEYRELNIQLLKTEKELDNLFLMLQELDVRYITNKDSLQYYNNKIAYRLLGDYKTLCFIYTTSYHYLSIKYDVFKKEWSFSNLDLLGSDMVNKLEWKIKLIKLLLEDYPLFIERMNKEINYKLKELF